jgi:soluble lytic murein transglycosylase
MKGFTIKDLEDPATNIRLGTYYLSKLLKEFEGSQSLALAAYNAGNSKVKEWRRQNPLIEVEVTDIPYTETQTYVQNVSRTYRILKWFHNLKDRILN